LLNEAILWFRFEGDTTDETGTHANGTLQGTAILITDVDSDRAGVVHVNGKHSVVYGAVRVNNSQHIDNGTWGAWVKPEAMEASLYNRIIYKNNGKVEVFTQAKDAVAEFRNNTDSGVKQTARNYNDLPLNTWTHLMATYDQSVLRLYLDGIQVKIKSASGPIYSNAGVMGIGAASGSKIYPWNGSIDDVMLFNRPLSASEIWDIYIEQGGGSGS
jgi:hypothetical protein